MSDAAAGSAAVFGGLFMMVLGIVLAVLAICWIILPFLIISKFNQVIKSLSAVQQQLELANYQRDKQLREQQDIAGGSL